MSILLLVKMHVFFTQFDEPLAVIKNKLQIDKRTQTSQVKLKSHLSKLFVSL